MLWSLDFPQGCALEYVLSFGPGSAEVVRAFDEDAVGLESSANGRGSVYTLDNGSLSDLIVQNEHIVQNALKTLTGFQEIDHGAVRRHVSISPISAYGDFEDTGHCRSDAGE